MITSEVLTADAKKYSAWQIFTGILTVAMGLFLILYPLAAATITTLLLGWILILVGVVQFIFAFGSPSIGNFSLKIFLGLLYGATGVALAFFPLAGVITLTGFLGTFLMMRAILEAITAFQSRPLQGSGWILFDALMCSLLASMILFEWPSSSAWAIGTLLGVSVIANGISKIMVAMTIRSGVGALENTF